MVVLLLRATAASKLSISCGKSSRIPCNYKGKGCTKWPTIRGVTAIILAQLTFAVEYMDTVAIQ
jgi:hypothetical protein